MADDLPYRIRPVEREDVAGCVEVFHRSYEALLASRGDPVPPRNSPPIERLFEHLVETDPGDAWLADADGSIAGFALAHRRGRRWFLAFLFVLPERQGRGLGRALLERSLPSDRAGWQVAVCAEAVQPVATALYASHGMVPRTPIYLVTGRLRPGALAREPDRLAATPLARLDRQPVDDRAGSPIGPAAMAALASVDRELLGGERAPEHQMLRATGRLGFLFHRPGAEAAAADPLGYGYVQPSGRIGPVLVREPSLLTAALAELTGALTPPDAWQAIVPGPAAAALGPLLEGGLRIDGSPAVYAADGDGVPFDRYLPMNFALI